MATETALQIDTAVAQWTDFLRQQNAFYAELAADRGEPFFPIEAAEMDAAARLAAMLGALPPARSAARQELYAIA